VEIGCDDAEGTFHLDPNGPDTCTGPMDSDITEEVFRSACKKGTGNFSDGGINADGDCIRLGVFWPQVPFAALSVFADLSLRPDGAELERVDLTDFKLIARGDGKGIPARARSPLGTLVFPGTGGGAFARRVDPMTGAPVNSMGALKCCYRTASGGESTSVGDSVGPDGIAGNADDTIPSVGNCLLWSNPVPSGDPNHPTQQFLRASDLIALSHPANQTIFHTLCTVTFDPQNGLCALDLTNTPGFFSAVSNILAGGFIGSLATDGLRWLRTTVAPFDGEVPGPEIESTMFAQIPGTDLSNLSPDQKALLGCGPAFLSPCGWEDVSVFTDSDGEDASISQLLEGRTAYTISGGPDLMNADASVVTQEMLSVRKHSPGALVGTRTATNGTQYFEAGITSAGMTPDEVIVLGESGRDAFVAENNERQLLNFTMAELRYELRWNDPNATDEEINAQLLAIPSYDPDFDRHPAADALRGGSPALVPVRSDAWIEPLPWEPDSDWLAQGVLVYQVANQNELDPRCHLYPEGDPKRDLFNPNDPVCFDDQAIRKMRTFNDPTDATNPLNLFLAGFGESCIQSFGDTERFLSGDRARAFDSGCTDLETATANFERLWIAFDILGYDRVPDPPESLEELSNMLDGDPNNDATGDPISGPDGILVQNLASGLGNAATSGLAQPFFEDGEKDVHVVRLEVPPQNRPGLVTLGQEHFRDPPEFVTLDVSDPDAIAEAAQRFMDEYDPTTCSKNRCHLVIAEDRQLTQVEFNEVIAAGEPKKLVTALPVSLAVSFGFGSDPNGTPDFSVLAPTHINFLEIYYQDPEAAMNLLDEEFDGGPEVFPSLVPVEIDGEQFFISSSGLRDIFLKEPGQPATNCQDLDTNGLCDFDQDDDGVYDGADDYTRGPVSDDRILCGSGLPGDVLQDAIQFEFARPSDEMAFDTVFPNALPPRSPVFCGGSQKLIGMTAESSPGQRAFIWHGAERSEDSDADAWPDLVDICPFFPNPEQDGNSDADLLCDEEDPCKFFTNTLPLARNVFSGIPEECMCGDFDGDGFHSATDAAAINDCAAFIRLDCVPERDEVTQPFDGFYSATDADLVNRVAAFIDPAYTLTCPRRPEGTCGGDTGVSCF
jgi:hypothetical protein